MTDDGLVFHATIDRTDGQRLQFETVNRGDLLAWIAAHGAGPGGGTVVRLSMDATTPAAVRTMFAALVFGAERLASASAAADAPRCACGDPVLDGHLTCGRLECDEGRTRRAIASAWITGADPLTGFVQRGREAQAAVDAAIAAAAVGVRVACRACGATYTQTTARPPILCGACGSEHITTEATTP